MSKSGKTYWTSMAVGLLMAAVVLAVNAESPYPWPQRLCDCFFVAAVLLLGAGGLQFAGNAGTFDVMGYGLKSVFHIHLPGTKRQEDEQEDFLTYQQKKAQGRKSPKPLLMAGLSYLAVAFLFLVMYWILK